mgnify:CR=1 FL=1
MEKVSTKFEIIHTALQKEDNPLDIQTMCQLAGVSRSGYYRWLSAEKHRENQEAQDRADFELILIAYNYRGYKKGARSIYMRLIHLDPPVVMNVKKIRRIMEKYSLYCPIRKANPYRRLAKATHTSHTATNLVNREFTAKGPRKVLLTDVSYIPYNGTFCYLSTIPDAYTRQVLAYELSESLEVDFVLQTIVQMVDKHGISLQAETIVHSDQGFHYTSLKFIQILKDSNLRQSISRRGNCWDNALQESFFGHMKDEITFMAALTFHRSSGSSMTGWTTTTQNVISGSLQSWLRMNTTGTSQPEYIHCQSKNLDRLSNRPVPRRTA